MISDESVYARDRVFDLNKSSADGSTWWSKLLSVVTTAFDDAIKLEHS